MHKDEIKINQETVKELIANYFPQHVNLPIRKINSMGTVNAIYRLGDEYCIRLPRLQWASEALLREFYILSGIKGITLNIPKIIQTGTPNDIFPHN